MPKYKYGGEVHAGRDHVTPFSHHVYVMDEVNGAQGERYYYQAAKTEMGHRAQRTSSNLH